MVIGDTFFARTVIPKPRAEESVFRPHPTADSSLALGMTIELSFKGGSQLLRQSLRALAKASPLSPLALALQSAILRCCGVRSFLSAAALASPFRQASRVFLNSSPLRPLALLLHSAIFC